MIDTGSALTRERSQPHRDQAGQQHPCVSLAMAPFGSAKIEQQQQTDKNTAGCQARILVAHRPADKPLQHKCDANQNGQIEQSQHNRRISNARADQSMHPHNTRKIGFNDVAVKHSAVE